jgi:hypothetical protein
MMRPLRTPCLFRAFLARFSCLACILVAAGVLGLRPAGAEPIPLPTADFEATATTLGGATMIMHHSGDKARVEVDVGITITGIMDLKTRKMLMIGAIPGMSNMAMEIGIGEASYGQVYGSGKRVGEDTVAGEPCQLWEMDAAKAGHDSKYVNGPVIVCLSRDHIPLRTQATVDGKLKTITEITQLKRVKQDPALFVMPKDVKVMKMPKGVGEGIAAGALGLGK